RRAGCRTFPRPLALCLWAFFGRCGQHPVWLIALKAGIFVECGVGAVRHHRFIRRLFVGRFARQRRPQRDDFARVLIDQEDVLVGMGLLLAAGVVLWLSGISWALATAFGAIHRQVWSACQGQRARRDTLRVALRVCARL